MKEFKGKVAVITGSASGIGLAMARRSAREGMKVVLSDIVVDRLKKVEEELKSQGAQVIAVPTDVSKLADVSELARRAVDAFGGVHLLCNNCGVGKDNVLWETPINSWKWIINVNIFGIIHGIHEFVPLMLKQDTPCHIVNTASAAGLFSAPGVGAYKVSKHAVVSLSETLYHELKEIGSKINVSLLCPGMVSTGYNLQSPPEELKVPSTELTPQPRKESADIARFLVEHGMPPDQVADIVFQSIREDKFYILTHPNFKKAIQTRMEDILQDRNPTNPFQSTEDLI